MWMMQVIERESFPEIVSDGLLYNLLRLRKFSSNCREIQVFDEVRIVHGANLSVPYGKAFKGQSCWSSTKRQNYRRNNGPNRSVLIEAYRNSGMAYPNHLDFMTDWQHSDFYIESNSRATPVTSERQAQLSRMELAALLSLFVLSGAKISSALPINYYKQPDTPGHSCSTYGHHIKKYHLDQNTPYFLNDKDRPKLIGLAKTIFDRAHPEAYLAGLRVIRAVNRREVDDSVVDLVISLEALFNETSDPGIALRIGQRLAHMLGQAKPDRRITLDTVKEAYKMRSNLVHGSRRQIDFLEDVIGGKRDRKTVELSDLRRIHQNLVHLLCSAIAIRHTDYQSLSQRELFEILDARAV